MAIIRREARECPNCDGTDFSVEAHTTVAYNVPDGSLRLNDVVIVYALGCNECSETLETTKSFNEAVQWAVTGLFKFL